MKLTDNLVNKFGADKLLHFLVAAWIVSEAKIYGTAAMLITTVIVLLLSVIKEVKLDSYASANDVLAAMCGCITSIGLYILWLNL